MITDSETNIVYISDLLKEKFTELHHDLTFLLREEKVPPSRAKEYERYLVP